MKDSLEEFRRFTKTINENIRRVAEVTNHYDRIAEAIRASIPKIDLSKINLPKIDFPELEIDYEKIEALTNHNSSHGWTLTGEMDFNFYLDEDLLRLKQQEIDHIFLEYYESDSKMNYESTKSAIVDEIDGQWKSVLNDCFELYEQDKYQVIIPMLMTVIEGEISNIAKSPQIGKRLLTDWKKQIPSVQERMMIIISYSLNQYLSSKIFIRKEFHEERSSSINRNWVLHGRDNPENWTKVDALKLINAISTLQFIKSR